MWLRTDTGGDIGVFEDLQTLVVVLVGISILLGSTLYNWAAYGAVEQDQEMFDEATHIVRQVEAWEWLGAYNSYGSPYQEFAINKHNLASLNTSEFWDRIKSTLHYNVTFDDLAIPDGESNGTSGNLSYYWFGDPVPEGKETVVARVQYSLVFVVSVTSSDYDVSERHACIMTVVVWR